MESDLNFLGLLILQNQLKPESTPVIGTLHSANIRTVMVTGDGGCQRVLGVVVVEPASAS